ncbi:MAG: MG2 domain-containing protein, partial [Planctomycetota bacterium]
MNHDQTPETLENDELRQELLELHYGLLDEEEAADLRARIESDADTAQLWRETLQVAGRFAEAAKVVAPPMSRPSLKAAPSTAQATSAPVKTDNSVERASKHVSSFGRWWCITLATAASVAFLFAGARHWDKAPSTPLADFKMAVQPVSMQTETSAREFLVVLTPLNSSEAADVVTANGGFDPAMPIVPASISFQVLHRGMVLFLGKTELKDSEPARISIPGSIAIPEDATLRIDASPDGYGERTIRMRVPLEPTRCLTYLSTDRPVYRPGETVFFRSVTLQRSTFAPSREAPIRFELFDPSGSIVDGCRLDGLTERGVGNGVFALPEQAVGGTYRLVATSLDGFFPEQSQEIEVRRYRAVKLKTKLQFDRRSYSHGETVVAALGVRRADDTVPQGAVFRASATVEGQVLFTRSGELNEQGEAELRFELPDVFESGDGWLTIAIDDGSVTETVARAIPIHTGKLQIDCYPEGGYLVTELKNRVYFVARDLSGEPIEIEGDVISQAGRKVASVETVRDGRGRFEFVPEAGQRYSIRVTKPDGISEAIWLPAPSQDLPVMETGDGVYEDGEAITFMIRSKSKRQCLVRAVCRGKLVGVKSVDVNEGDTEIFLPVERHTAGVIRLTVLDAESEQAVPLVERLVFRRSDRGLDVSVETSTPDGEVASYAPGETVRLTIAAKDESGEPLTNRRQPCVPSSRSMLCSASASS